MADWLGRLWVVFTAFDVFSVGLVTYELSRLGDDDKTNVIPVRKWVVVCQIVAGLLWMHWGAAWIVLRGFWGVAVRLSDVIALALT